MTASQQLLGYLVALGALAIALRGVSHRAHLPYPVALAAGGILVGLIPGSRPAVVSPDLILLAFVPGLVFQAAFTVELAQLRRLVAPVTLLATIGVALTVLGTGAAVHLVVGLPWPDAFLLAAILAPTDPIAVVSVLRTIRAPRAVTTLLEGESLINDGTGVAIFTALAASVASGSPSLGDVAGRFAIATGLGIAVGLAWGGAGSLVLRATGEAGLEFLATLTLAYGAYLTADFIHGSGIVAVVTAALVLVAIRQRLHLHGKSLLEFWDVMSFVLNAALFLLIGTALPTDSILTASAAVALVFIALTVVRAATVYAIMAATDWKGRGIPWRARPLLAWGGMRGALSVALALSLSGRPGIDNRVVAIGYGVVLLSLILQGSTVRPLVRASKIV